MKSLFKMYCSHLVALISLVWCFPGTGQATSMNGAPGTQLFAEWKESMPDYLHEGVGSVVSNANQDLGEIKRLLAETENALREGGDVFNERRWEALDLALRALPDTHALHWYHAFYHGFYEVECGDVQRAVLYAELALQMADYLKEPALQLNSLWLLMALNKQMGNFDTSLKYFDMLYKAQQHHESQRRKVLAGNKNIQGKPTARSGMLFWWLTSLVLLTFVGWYFIPYKMVIIPSQPVGFKPSRGVDGWLKQSGNADPSEAHALTDEEIVVDEKKVELLARLRSHKMVTQEDWEGFEQLFNQIYPDFLIHLRFKHRDVTPSEEKLACLIRAHFSTKEIARILAVSTHTVNVGRHRLKKRVKLSLGSVLEEYLMRF